MNVTINLAGTAMFVALLLVAVAVLVVGVLAIASIVQEIRLSREKDEARGYDRALRDVAADLLLMAPGEMEPEKSPSKYKLVRAIKKKVRREVEEEYARITGATKRPTSDGAE